MDVISACPLRVASILWQPKPRIFVLTVVCKATYLLLPAESPLARDQDPPNEADVHWNDDERWSLRAASDLAPFKRRADVFLVGHAYAPGMQPVSSLCARLLVGDVDKTIEVHRDRAWTQGGRLRHGERFARMRICYERAGGGPETSNPVGIGAATPADTYGQVRLPNLQPPGLHVTRPGDVIPPIGLGPIAPAWPTRSMKLRRHAAGWDHRAWSTRPLPDDIDQLFFNAAPPDQQVGDLRSNERIVLENLHAEHARLVTSLSGFSPHAWVKRPRAAAQEIALRCDTLSIDTDRGICNLVWRGQVSLARPDEAGRVIIAGQDADSDDTFDTHADAVLPGDALRFAGSASAAAPAKAPLEMDDAVRTLHGSRASGPALPFREGMSALATSAEGAALPVERRATGTLLGVMRRTDEALPFLTPTGLILAVAPAPAWVEAPSFVASPEPPTASVVEPEAPEPKRAFPRPPMIGPLAGQNDGLATPEPPLLVNAEASAPAVPAPVTEAEPDIDFDAYPPERCGAIVARLVCDEGHDSDILRAEELDASRWKRVHEHWLARICDEAARSRKKLLSEYDAAYVSALESKRGPIGFDDYARLAEAAERNAVAGALAERRLPDGAWPHIHRVWIGRMVKDVRLGKQVRAKIDALRAAG